MEKSKSRNLKLTEPTYVKELWHSQDNIHRFWKQAEQRDPRFSMIKTNYPSSQILRTLRRVITYYIPIWKQKFDSSRTLITIHIQLCFVIIFPLFYIWQRCRAWYFLILTVKKTNSIYQSYGIWIILPYFL